MKTIQYVCSLSLVVALFGIGDSFAHQGGHHAPTPALNDGKLKEKAKKDVAIIVKSKGKEKVDGETLDQSWSKIPDDKIKIAKKDRGAVVVSFENSAKKKTLYVLLLDYGRYIGANFTGKFEGL